MTPEKNRWVVDASVGIKLFITEEYSERAEALFGPLGGDPSMEMFVPDLFYAECANILWKHVRRFGYPASEARRDISQLGGLYLKVVSAARLIPKALDLALRWEISAYDGCYVALAEELKSPLVTADEKLFKRIRNGSASVKWIGDFSRK
ncbi:MAG TPA: type II toxin-antitoxin system VapC family toxin [bacterium]|nr:type II toxin-antitoxin system VapC family toxin [bacterium]